MKKKRFYLGFYAVPLAVVLILFAFGALTTVSDKVNDLVYQSRGKVSGEIFVVGIDEETLAEYGPFTEWSRQKTAELVELLTADPASAPAVIALDIGFYGERDAETDARLVQAVRRAGNVVLVSTVTFGDVLTTADGKTERQTQIILYEEPFDALKAAAAGVGHSNVQLDEDGVARHAFGTLEYAGEPLNSFSRTVYEVRAQKRGADPEPAQKGSYYISFTGQPRDYYGEVGAGASFVRVLNGEYPAQVFAGGIVYVGAYASGMQDNYYTSVSGSTQMYGVEVHANLLDQMLNGRVRREVGKVGCFLFALLLGAAVLVLLWFTDTKISVPCCYGIGVLYFAAAFLLYRFGDWLLPLLVPLLPVAVTPIVHILVQYFTVRAEKKRIIANYGKYLSPEIAASIAETGEDALRLGGTKKDIAVLFVDIRSFTTLSESLPPEKVVEMLNSYLTITTTAIFHNKGTVDKFIGDATMGVFNAPLDLEDYTFRAVCAGLEMAREALALDDRLAPELRGRVGFGVGINCGEAVVGNIGTSFRMEYTAIGDTVNTASRLEGQAKAGCVVISEAVWERVRDRVDCEDMGFVRLKGKADEVHIYKAKGIKGDSPAP